MEDFATLEKLEAYFKEVNGYGKENCCFLANTIPSSILLAMFGALGGYLATKKNKNVMGYLCNRNENGFCLIPIVSDTLTKNKVAIEQAIFLKHEEIEKVTLKNEDIGFKKITIRLKDKNKYVLKVAKKIVKLDYQKKNLDRLIEMYQ